MNEQVTLLPNRRHLDRATSLFTATPLMDLVEREEGFILYCNMPGVDCDEIDLTVHKGILRIRAEALFSPPPGKIHALEMNDTVYEARLRLTAAVDTAAVTAVLSCGVLRVHLPFALKSGPVRIPVLRG